MILSQRGRISRQKLSPIPRHYVRAFPLSEFSITHHIVNTRKFLLSLSFLYFYRFYPYNCEFQDISLLLNLSRCYQDLFDHLSSSDTVRVRILANFRQYTLTRLNFPTPYPSSILSSSVFVNPLGDRLRGGLQAPGWGETTRGGLHRAVDANLWTVRGRWHQGIYVRVSSQQQTRPTSSQLPYGGLSVPSPGLSGHNPRTKILVNLYRWWTILYAINKLNWIEFQAYPVSTILIWWRRRRIGKDNAKSRNVFISSTNSLHLSLIHMYVMLSFWHFFRSPFVKNTSDRLLGCATRLLPPRAKRQVWWAEFVAQPKVLSDNLCALIWCSNKKGVAVNWGTMLEII